MLRFFARTDKSPIAQWWWTVDRWLVAAVVVLIGLGYLMALRQPRRGPTYRQADLLFCQQAIGFSHTGAGCVFRRLHAEPAPGAHVGAGEFHRRFAGVVATLFVGTSAKGASRWLIIAGVSFSL